MMHVKVSRITRRRSSPPPRQTQRGVTLIEVLVALLVLSIGLLGLAGLQTVALQHNQAAYMRSQATNLAHDVADRMRANREAALAGDYDTNDCDAPTEKDPDDSDLGEWCAAVRQLPGGTASISRSDNRFTITIQWGEERLEGDDGTDQFVTVIGI